MVPKFQENLWFSLSLQQYLEDTDGEYAKRNKMTLLLPSFAMTLFYEVFSWNEKLILHVILFVFINYYNFILKNKIKYWILYTLIKLMIWSWI